MNHRCWLLALLCIVAAGTVPGLAQATTPTATDPLKVNPATTCMEARFSGKEPDAQRTVTAAAILEVLRSGRCLRVDRAIIQGDLDLRALPVNGVDATGGDLVSINGAFVVTRSMFNGAFIASPDDAGLRLRFKGPLVLTGSTLADVDLSQAQIEQEALFNEAQFGNVRLDRTVAHSISFRQAQFNHPVFLTGLSLGGDLDLSHARFGSLVRAFGVTARRLILDEANFQTTTDFTGARVEELSARDARFLQGADFSRATVSGNTDMAGAQFEGATQFGESLFAGSASFQGAHFRGASDFAQVRFRSEAWFQQGVFEQALQFSFVVFHGPTYFTRARFLAATSFEEARFLGWTDFRDASFAALDLSNAVFANPVGPDWAGASFAGEAILLGVTSAGTWHVERGQFKGNHDFLPWQKRFAESVKFILLGAAAAGVAVILLMKLRQ